MYTMGVDDFTTVSSWLNPRSQPGNAGVFVLIPSVLFFQISTIFPERYSAEQYYWLPVHACLNLKNKKQTKETFRCYWAKGFSRLLWLRDHYLLLLLRLSYIKGNKYLILWWCLFSFLLYKENKRCKLFIVAFYVEKQDIQKIILDTNVKNWVACHCGKPEFDPCAWKSLFVKSLFADTAQRHFCIWVCPGFPTSQKEFWPTLLDKNSTKFYIFW